MPYDAARIRLCGRLSVEIDGEQLGDALPGRQGRLLFAYLVLNRDRPVRRDELVDAVWGDNGDGAGSADLRPPLSRLRKVLGPDRLAGRSELALVLPADTWIDWEGAHESLDTARAANRRGDARAAAAAATEAVEIAGQELLPGLDAKWIEERRRQLEELRIEALELVADAGLALGGDDLANAEHAARAAVDAAPFRESAYATLMRILRARGNVAEALQAYERIRTVLGEELGTPPGPALTALHEELLRAESQPAVRAGDNMLERDRELAVVDSLLAETPAGEGRLALFEGPMGVGKSRLLAAARSSATVAGIRTLSARASELEREFPFGVVRQLFEAAVADPAERERLLSGAAAPAAAVFGADTATAPGVDASFASLHGLFWLAVNLSTDGPLVLAIDDLHWSDTPSLRFVAYLAQRLDGLPILLAATLRTGEGAADATLLAEIARDPAAVSIRPRPLTEAAVAALVRGRLGDDASDAFCTACHRATVGNPLLTRQLLTALEADGIEPVAANAELVRRIGPTAVSRSVLLRIARLGDEPRSVARAVAVLGESAELPTIGALAELDEESVATAASKLARSEVLRAEPPPGFVHPLVRDAVYHDLSLGERELQHERAARLLAETGAPAERVASHVLAMPRRGDPWASELLVEASRGAMAKGAGESAAAYLARALAEPPPSEQRPKVLFELGMAERLTSAASAARHLEAAYTSTVDPVERGHVAYALGSVRLFSGAPGGAAEVTREAAAALPHGNDDLEQRLLAVELSAPFFAGGRAELRRLDRFRDVHGPMTIGMRMLLSITALNWAHTGSTADECSDLALRALGNGELIASDAGLTAIPAIFALAMADRDEAVVAWEQATAEAHRNGSLISMALIGLWHGMTAYFRGEFDEAEDLLTTGLGRVERWGLGPSVHTFGRAVLAAVLLARGRREEAWLHIDAVEDTGEDSDALGFWLWSKTDLLLNDRRWDDVIATADEFARRYPDTLELGATITESMRAMALAQLGRREEALEILHEQLAASQHWGAPTRLGPSYRILAGVETERALEYLHESLAVLEPSPNRLQHAKTLFALAQHLRGTGSADEAVDHLRLALEMAEASGADRLLGDIAAELRELGVEIAPGRPTGATALTPTERRVAGLAASGATELEIAQETFMTPSAVETHLAGAKRKLGVGARAELAAALAS